MRLPARLDTRARQTVSLQVGTRGTSSYGKESTKVPPGPELDTLTAENVFGWKYVHKHDGALVGKKQDKAGRWRSANVPSYPRRTPVDAYSIDERMKQLGSSEKYLRELSRLTRANRIPADWATPEQRAKAALKVARRKQSRFIVSSRPRIAAWIFRLSLTTATSPWSGYLHLQI